LERVARTSWIAALAIIALGLSSGLAAAQQAEDEAEGKTLEVTSTSEEAKAFFWDALDDAENIFFERAAVQLQQALALDPDFGLARVLHGWATPGLTSDERQSEISRGIAALSEASAGELQTALAMRELSVGNTSAAKSMFVTASEMLPDDPHLAYFAAWVTNISDGPGDGIPALRSVTERFPDNAPAYNILAYTLWQSGDRDGGLDAVRRYVERAPNHPNSHDSYAELLQWAGRYSSAMAEYERAAELDASYAAAYIGMAEIHQLMGQGRQAREALSQAIQLEVVSEGAVAARPPSVQARLNRMRAQANSYLMDGNRQAGMDLLANVATEAEAADIKSQATLAHQQLALADAVLGRGRYIESHLQNAAEIGGADNPQQYAYAVWAYGSAGQMAPAREALEKLEEATAGNENWQTPVHSLRGLLHLQENETTKAMDELEQADPEDVYVKALLAECYKKMGRSHDARSLRDEVLNNRQLNLFSPLTPVAYLHAKKL
jgi:tetratricopeptide (TPR) repeat protein